MALNGVFDLSQTPASNVDFLGTSVLGTGLVSTADDSFRNLASFLARWRDDLGGVAVTAGTNTLTVTANQAFAAYATGQRYLFKLGGTNTGAATLNITPSGGAALGAKNIKVLVAGVATDPTAGQLTSGNYAEFQYDGTNMNLLSVAGASFATNAQAATASSTTVALTPANLAQERGYSLNLFSNVMLGLPTVSGNALTIPITGVDGNVHSASNIGYVDFRSATVGTGAVAQLTVTASTSIVVSSGSTLGATNNVAFRGWIVAFNDAGTLRLGVINCTTLASGILTQYPLSAFGIASSTAEGGAGAADSAQTFYTGTAVTSKAYTVLGYFSYESGLAAVGTYGAAPTRTQTFDPTVPLPGRVVQVARTQDSAFASGTTVVPGDDTIPQNTEGDQYMSKAITPSSAANILNIEHQGQYTNTAAGGQFFAASIFQDATAGALATGWQEQIDTSGFEQIGVNYAMIAGTTSATTFKIRSGYASAGTTGFNGQGGSRKYGGVSASWLEIEEIAA